MSKKYTFVKDDKFEFLGQTLYRIKALRSFGDVKRGDLGGYIAKEENLSHDGTCWVYDEAWVMDDARVYEDGKVRDRAVIWDDGRVGGIAEVKGDLEIPGPSGINAIFSVNEMIQIKCKEDNRK